MFGIPFTKNNTTGFGIGLGFSHYSNRTAVMFDKDYTAQTTTITLNQPNVLPKTMKMGFNHLEIPIEFRFRLPYGDKDKQYVKFMLGGKFGFRVQSYTRYKFTNKQVIKEIHLPDSNLLRYGITARIGIRNCAIYGAYYFSPLFRSKNSTQLYPFEIGLSIALF